MIASEPNFNGLLDLDREDILAAMKKLTKIIQSDKQFDMTPHQQQQPKQHFSSPPRIHSRSPQHVAYTPKYPQQQDYYDDNELVEGLRHVHNNLSHYDAHNTSALNETIGTQTHGANPMEQSSKFISFQRTPTKQNKNREAINRLHELDNKKREKIAAKQFQQYKEELSTLRSKPQISLNSKIIAEQKRKVPIYERTHAVMKQREENINKIRRELEGTRDDRDMSPTFQPDLSFTKRYNLERSRTVKEFTSQVYAWQHRKNENIQKEQYENITKELTELTFKPKINTKSRYLAERIYNHEPVEERLQKHKDHIEEKRLKLLEKDKPTFKPILNERSLNLATNRRNNGDKSHRREKSTNLSFVDVSREENRRSTQNLGRSLTPTRKPKTQQVRDKSPRYMQASPKFNEIKYSPAVEFLLRKLEQ